LSRVKYFSQITELAFFVENLVGVAEGLAVGSVLRLDLEALTKLFDEAEELLARVLPLERVEIKLLIIPLHYLDGADRCLLQVGKVGSHLELLDVLHGTKRCRPCSYP